MRKFIPAILLLLTACAPDPPHQNKTQTNVENQQHWIHYYKDTRTNICFAGSGGRDQSFYYYNTVLTYVPCSPEVEALVEPWPRIIGGEP